MSSRPKRSRSAAAWRQSASGASLANSRRSSISPLVIDQPWTDWAGRRHDKMVGRPIAMHAMRGISAHSNGFHTCRALHVLQMLLGAVDTPGSWRYKAPYPKPPPGGPKPAGKVSAPNTPLGGMPLGFTHGSGGSAGRREGRADPHRQGLFLGSAAFRARHDAHGDPQRLGRRSLSDRRAVHVHGEHGVELVHEHGRHHEDADRQERGRHLQDPEDHLLGRIRLRDGVLRRPRAAGHDLSRTLGLHLAARPADRKRACAGRCDPPAGADARPRRQAVPGCADRTWRPASVFPAS